MSELTSDCGSHCGVKDGIVGHCKCANCHDGVMPKGGWRRSLKGKLIPRNFKGDV